MYICIPEVTDKWIVCAHIHNSKPYSQYVLNSKYVWNIPGFPVSMNGLQPAACFVNKDLWKQLYSFLYYFLSCFPATKHNWEVATKIVCPANLKIFTIWLCKEKVYWLYSVLQMLVSIPASILCYFNFIHVAFWYVLLHSVVSP